MIRDLVEEDVAALVGTLNFKQKVDRSLSLIRSAWQEFGDASDGRLAQLVRARGSHPRGHRFESCSAHHYPVSGKPPQLRHGRARLTEARAFLAMPTSSAISKSNMPTRM